MAKGRSCFAPVVVNKFHSRSETDEQGRNDVFGFTASLGGGQTVTAAMAAVGSPETKQENRQKLPAPPSVRASDARRCSSVMLVMTALPVAAARRGPFSGLLRFAPLPPAATSCRRESRRWLRASSGENGNVDSGCAGIENRVWFVIPIVDRPRGQTIDVVIGAMPLQGTATCAPTTAFDRRNADVPKTGVTESRAAGHDAGARRAGVFSRPGVARRRISWSTSERIGAWWEATKE